MKNFRPEEPVKATFEELLSESGMSARWCLGEAVEDIDKALGKGYAAKHPELVTAYMEARLRYFSAAASAKVFSKILDHIGDALDRGAMALSEIAEAIDKRN